MDENLQISSIADTADMSIGEAWFAWWEGLQRVALSGPTPFSPGLLPSLLRLTRLAFYAGEGHAIAAFTRSRCESDEALAALMLRVVDELAKFHQDPMKP